jgi:NTE family protein
LSDCARIAESSRLWRPLKYAPSGCVYLKRQSCHDAPLASACLPALHQGAAIYGEAYWDGGYAGNPALFPLSYNCYSLDLMTILLHPLN